MSKGKIYILLLVLTTIFFYKGITSLFFQQDEWQGLGNALLATNFSDLTKDLSITSVFLGEGRIMARYQGYYFFKNFYLNTRPLALFSLTFHVINVLLLYKLGLKLLKNKELAFLSALFFALSGVHMSAVSWFSTSLGTLPAVSLILLSVFFFPEYPIASFLLLYLSLFFKEIGLYLFMFLPIALYFSKSTAIEIIKKYWYFMLFFIVNSVYRFTHLFQQNIASPVFITNEAENAPGIFSLLLTRALGYTLTSFSLMYIPAKKMINLAFFVTTHYYPSALRTDIVEQNAVIDTFALALTVILLFIIFIKVNKNTKKNIILLLIITIASFLPYIIISKGFAYLDSRHYYLPLAFGSMLLVWLLCSTTNPRKLLVGLTIYIAILYTNILALQSQLNIQKSLAKERRGIIEKIYESVPSLTSKNNIFLFESNHEYYVPENKLPFQQGFGYTLITMYYSRGLKAANLLEQNFLWTIGSEGLHKSDDFTFGLYFSETNMKSEISEMDIDLLDIHKFYYDYDDSSLQYLGTI